MEKNDNNMGRERKEVKVRKGEVMGGTEVKNCFNLKEMLGRRKGDMNDDRMDQTASVKAIKEIKL